MNDEEVVRTADQIVRAAWFDEMLRCRCVMLDGIRVAQDYQNAAQRYLSAALREGGAGAIAAAWRSVHDSERVLQRNRAAAGRLLPLIERELLACASRSESDH
jgi:hypothetical protein